MMSFMVLMICGTIYAFFLDQRHKDSLAQWCADHKYRAHYTRDGVVCMDERRQLYAPEG